MISAAFWEVIAYVSNDRDQSYESHESYWLKLKILHKTIFRQMGHQKISFEDFSKKYEHLGGLRRHEFPAVTRSNQIRNYRSPGIKCLREDGVAIYCA